MKEIDYPFSKQNFIRLKEDREELLLTIASLQKDNKELKNKINDLKITLKSNKELLQDYANQIYEKDQLYDKLNATIDDLKIQLTELEKKEKKYAENIYRSSTSKLNTMFYENENNKEIKNDENIEDNNFFFKKQNIIMDELFGIKENLRFLIRLFGKRNIKKNLNESINLEENLNASFYSEKNNNEGANNLNEFDNSFISENIEEISENNNKCLNGANKIIFNLNKRYDFDDNFTKFIEQTDLNDDLILLVDGKENLWEIIKRDDLTLNQVREFTKSFKKFEREVEGKS